MTHYTNELCCLRTTLPSVIMIAAGHLCVRIPNLAIMGSENIMVQLTNANIDDKS